MIKKSRHLALVDSLEKIDALTQIKQEREKMLFDSMLKNDKHFADSVYTAYEAQQAKLPKDFPRAILEGSNYQPGTGGSAYEEKETNGGLKFKINYLTGDDFNEMHCEIRNQFLGASVHRLQDWFLQLEMNLASLNSYSYNSPVDFKEILRAAVKAQKTYGGDSWHAEDVIKPFSFKGGDLRLEKIESDGRFTTLKFTIYIQKTKP